MIDFDSYLTNSRNLFPFNTNIVHIFNICKYYSYYFEYLQHILIFGQNLLIGMEEKRKQERTIVHLEKDGCHYYYGNLKALTDHWDKNAIGVTYAYIKNLNISNDNPYRNEKCVIRRGIIVTSPKK